MMHGVQLTVDDIELTLIPTLRAAMTLNNRFGMETILDGVIREKFSIIEAVIHACAVNANPRDIAKATRLALRPYPAPAFTEAILNVVLGLAGATPDLYEDADDTEATKGTKSTTSTEKPNPKRFYAELFEVATGWLGYTPKDALDCTPGQILAAQRGRAKLLNQLFGSGAKDKAQKPYVAKDPKSRDALMTAMFANAVKG
ncbi:hypothetical protein DLJ53_27595 [Acuticoccus sediminis]|uniref:Tail assembly chaperone n=1 Tax=Acuticoccus sediminis TaxID=2184697 RepID=A0A8B2NIZ3_9HYPH|nr:hypothetical protein [Acuticoccus sediminis]RAH97622.1 hypothetical protein DLJ53_27595 [Acuticoccus sediminis]